MNAPRLRRTAVLFGAAGAALSLVLGGCAAEQPSQPVAEDSAADSVAAATPTTIVTIGDSIMAGFGLDEDEAWPALLASDTGLEVVNLACSGAGFVVEGDCGEAFSGLIPAANDADPDLILIQSSDNDLFESEDDIDTDTAATIAALHAALPDARIVGIGTLWQLPFDEPDSIGWSSDALESAVTGVGGTFVSIGQPLQDDSDLVQWDEEHPTAEGQRVLLAAVVSALDGAGVSL